MFNKTDTHLLHLATDYQIGCYADRMAKKQQEAQRAKAKCGTTAAKQQR